MVHGPSLWATPRRSEGRVVSPLLDGECLGGAHEAWEHWQNRVGDPPTIPASPWHQVSCSPRGPVQFGSRSGPPLRQPPPPTPSSTFRECDDTVRLRTGRSECIRGRGGITTL